MAKKEKMNNILIGITILIVILVLFIISPFSREAYCSTKAQMTSADGIMVPAKQADVQQVPNLNFKVGQKIGARLSNQLACERQAKRFILF